MDSSSKKRRVSVRCWSNKILAPFMVNRFMLIFEAPGIPPRGGDPEPVLKFHRIEDGTLRVCPENSCQKMCLGGFSGSR